MLSANYVILPLQIVLALCIAIALFRRKLQLRLPLFFAYIVYVVLAGLARLATTADWAAYFKTFWITEAGDVLLSLTTAYYAFVGAFRGLFVLRRFRLVFLLLVFAVGSYAMWTALAVRPARVPFMISVIVGSEKFFQYLIVGLFCLMLAIKKALRFVGSSFEARILGGFALASLGMLLSAILFSVFGTRFASMQIWAGSVAYIGALIVWIMATLAPTKEVPGAGVINAEIALRELAGAASVLRKIVK